MQKMDVSGLASWLKLKTVSGKEALENRTWQNDPKSASYKFASCKAVLQKTKLNLADDFEKLAEVENKILPLVKPATDLETETYSELIFLSDWSKPLNFIPYLLAIWSIIRIYILPGLSLMLPLLIVIMPYLIIRFILHVPLDTSTYWGILYKMLKGQMPIGPGGELVASSESANPTDMFKFMGQLAWVGTTLFQSIAQPYWNFKHLKKVDEIISEKGNAVLELSNLYDSIKSKLETVGIKIFKNPLATGDARLTLASVLADPIPARHCLRLLGQLEVFLALAKNPGICPARFVNSETPVLKLKGCFDFNVPGKKQKNFFDIDLSNRFHALLTGPNRGGKSTVLRAINASVNLAHMYGCSFGFDCEITPLVNLFTCLKPDDLPGTKSRFEREVDFTAGTLRPRGNALILIDELYHSTNPSDATEACKYYLDKLWKQPGIMSIISTHIFDIVEDSDEKIVQRLCCPAEDLGNGRVHFLYGLEPGICKVSSVHELLVRAGMR